MHRGYIFDMDGVLTDTVEMHYKAWKRLLDEENIPFNREINEKLRGLTRRDSLEVVMNTQDYSESQLQEFMTRKNGYFREMMQTITPQSLLPGIADLFAQAKAEGIKLAVGSSSRNARDVCEKLGVLDQLNAFGDAYSIVNPKPAPDIFLWVAGSLGLNPRDCLVFEDAAAGVEAALAGGFWTCGIGPEARVGNAHWVRPDLNGVKVSDFDSEESA